MRLKIPRTKFEQCPIQRYLPAGIGTDIVYDVSDEFVRDLKIEVLGGTQTNYTTFLVRLIFKADKNNLNKLSIIYPEECLTIWAYRHIPGFYKQILE